MAKKKNRVLCYVKRSVGAVVITGVLAGTCMVPSKVRAQEDLTSDYVDLTYKTLLGQDPDVESFGFWYNNLKNGNTTAAGMIEMLTESEAFKAKGYDSGKSIDTVSLAMTGKEPDQETRAKYTDYLDKGVSLRTYIYEVTKDPGFASACAQYGITPGEITDLEPMDKNPELAAFVGEIFTEMYGRAPVAKETNIWVEFFYSGKEVAPTIDQIIHSSEFASLAKSDDQTIDALCHVMLGRDASSDEKALYLSYLDNGASMSYVTDKISDSQAFADRCTRLGIAPGHVTLTQPRDNNYELTSFLTRLYSRFSGNRPGEDDLNKYVNETIEDPGRVREVISQMLSTPESQALLESDDDFLNTVFEVFYGQAPEQEKIQAYKIGLSNGITRERVLYSILQDPAFDTKMSEYGIDTHVEKVVPEKIVALTFDDGPYTDVTMRILDVLEPYGAHATFFVTGDRVNRYRDCIIRATNMHCEIGDHTWNHTTLTKISGDAVHKQIWDTADAIYNLTGIYPKVMRPVGGSYNSTVAENVDMPMILWSIDTNDWKYRDSQHVINEVLTNVRDGDIILCHDLYETTATAMETVIPELINRGYTLVTISELAEYKKKELQNGKAYSSMRG